MLLDVDFTEQSPVILSLCPGMRGLERGFERACRKLNWQHPRTAAYVEIEAFINWNLVEQMEQGVLDPAPIWSNIKTFDGKPFRGKVHGIFGGYPCQPFSLAGERRGTDDARHLWPYISGIIESIEPVFCFFENVAGHLSMGFDEVYRSLRDMGYTVEPGLFTAEEVGAPHERKRLFILAVKKELVNTENARNGGRSRFISETNGRQNGKLLRQLSGSGKCMSYPNSFEPCEERFYHGEMCCVPKNECESKHGTPVSGGIGAETGETMANTTEQGSQERRRQSANTQCPAVNGICEMAHTHCTGFESERNDQIENNTSHTGNFNSGTNSFPAGPGEDQYEWEHPRIHGYTSRLPGSIRAMWSKSRAHFAQMLGEKIWTETDFRIKAHFESSVGFTINGYNFREDLLRMAGNGVVEQTAELAFTTLWKKLIT